ncbi:E3 ubiquitin-protein ligase PPP1R11 [Parasteatoda tepidariorum]|uniref:E3 ubiquitin-protein ligase PPP1R11 n=1 Tax=Parasteatoda tepidariorum TaxID=114398 RepID=UPI000A2C0C10|nr:E3 ubiquitin-protein ligase PPP1R11 [Parasteatoda tepidariorum]
MAGMQKLKTEEATASSTVVIESDDNEATASLQSVKVKLKKPKKKKKVGWTADTVDNENMNKKKSKCCCIYEKPRKFDESSSETDDECEHCKGHVERKHQQASASVTSVEENHTNDPENK